jgi:ketosteroid isomerase-like protein
VRRISEQNVELVRRFLEAIERAFDAYWNDPRSIAAAMEADVLWPEWREVFGYAHPRVEWRMAFLGETQHGHLAAAAAWDDFLTWAEDYRSTLEEAADLGGDHVLAVVTIASKGRESRARLDARLFIVLTVREGLFVRIIESTDRKQALEAAGLDAESTTA